MGEQSSTDLRAVRAENDFEVNYEILAFFPTAAPCASGRTVCLGVLVSVNYLRV